MGGVVSTGQDNDDLVDNLKEAEYIKSEKVEQVFRIVDRAHYYLEECRESAYKDLAWKSGTLHLSAPCIYSEVMEALDLNKGLSFLNLGSGTGYLNTMVGYMIGPTGINHGIELHASNVTYAEQRLKEFKESSPKFDDLELCDPVFVEGNCLNLAPDNRRYDRVYCGAACPSELTSTVQNLIKINGILVVPVGDQLLKIKRISETDFASENVLPVSFASLVEPSTPKDVQEMIMMPEVNPLSLQDVCRLTIRESIRSTFTFDKHPPKASHNSSSKHGRLLHPSQVFTQERGRYPLNILPTTQGLMIMGAFSDDSEASDGSEQFDGGFLDEQLQRHALGRRQNMDTADVDSNFSDEEKSETEEAPEGSQKEYLHSVREKLESMESEDGIVADDEGDDDEFEMKEMKSEKEVQKDVEVEEKMTCSRKEDGNSKGTKCSSNKNGGTKRMKVVMGDRKGWGASRDSAKPDVNRTSLSSDDEVILPESNAGASPAIEMNVFDSKSRTIKTSYSTSAETSETSGFGSLGDDQMHVGSIHSGLGNLDDDVAEDKSDKSSDSALKLPQSPVGNSNSKDKKSLWLSSSHQSDSTEGIDTANDDEEENSDDAVEEAWMDIDDDVDHRNNRRDTDTKKGEKSAVEGNASDSQETDKDKEAGKNEELKPPTLPPTGFTVFLKKQVDTLPIPRTMKTFICHFR